MTQLANFVFFFVEYLPEDDRKRPKLVLLYKYMICTFVHNHVAVHVSVLICCAVTGTNTVKLSYCTEYGEN
jgi:hypothetical protein